MDFKDKLQHLRGMSALYQGVPVTVVQYYSDTDMCLIRIHEGYSYCLGNDSIQASFVSDGNDTICVYADLLKPITR